jgi:hypothetical protein
MVALSDNLTQQFDKDVWVEIIKREKLP